MIKARILFKITVPFVGILIVAIATVAFFSVARSSQAIRAQQERKAAIFTQSLATNLLDALSFSLTAKVKEITRDARQIDDEIVGIAVVAPDGKCIASTDESQINSLLAETPFDRQVLSMAQMTQRDVPGVAHVFEVSYPLSSNGATMGFLRVRFSRQNIVRDTQQLILLNILVAGAALLIGTMIYFFYSKAFIIQPLAEAKAIALKIAAGDLDHKLQIRTNDEIGELSAVFEVLTEGLSSIVWGIRNISDSVEQMAHALSGSADQTNNSAQELSRGIQNIAKGITVQSQKFADASQIMNKLAVSVKQVSDNAQRSTKTSLRARELAQHGKSESEHAIERINRITQVAGQMAGQVERLGERSREIGRIVDLITGISDQTNMLALNAAIEAARAGDVGRGFAVVAEEVRKLAENSAQAAKQIANLITAIQKEMAQVIAAVKISTDEVAVGKTTIESVGQALDKILTAADETSQMVTQIQSATDAQLVDTAAVNKSLGDVSAYGQQSVSTTQECSASVEEMTATMQEVAASSQELVRMAGKLQELVKQFKTAEQTGSSAERAPVAPQMSNAADQARRIAARKKKRIAST